MWKFTSMRSPKPLTWNRSTYGNFLVFREYFPPTLALTLAPTLTRTSPYILARSHVQFSRLRSYSFDLCHGALVLFPFFPSLDHSVPQSSLNFLYVISPFLFPFCTLFLESVNILQSMIISAIITSDFDNFSIRGCRWCTRRFYSERRNPNTRACF